MNELRKTALTTAVEEAQSHFVDRWSQWHDIEDGAQVRVKFIHDGDVDPFKDGDYLGEVEYAKRNRDTGYDQRPSRFDGAARKIHTRDGHIWWQPPEDAKTDATIMAAVEERVQGWFLNEWTMLVLCVEVASAECPHCGERNTETGYLGGMESDTDVASFVEAADDIVHDQLAELAKVRA